MAPWSSKYPSGTSGVVLSIVVRYGLSRVLRDALQCGATCYDYRPESLVERYTVIPVEKLEEQSGYPRREFGNFLCRMFPAPIPRHQGSRTTRRTLRMKPYRTGVPEPGHSHTERVHPAQIPLSLAAIAHHLQLRRLKKESWHGPERLRLDRRNCGRLVMCSYVAVVRRSSHHSIR